jgi:hypothetical protein
VTEAKPKSTIRQLLESGPTDPLVMEKLSLVEELQAAHAQNDHKKMLEIGRKLAQNAKDFEQALQNRRTVMESAVAKAKAVAHPEERAKKLLATFAFCAKAACAADEETGDTDTYNFGVRQLGAVSDELETLNRFHDLAQFLDDPDIEIRGFSAVWLRNHMPERILPILREINKTEKFGTPVGTQVYIAMRELERVQERNTKEPKDSDAKP